MGGVFTADLAAKSVWRTVYPTTFELGPVNLSAVAAALGLELVAWEPDEPKLLGALVRSARTVFVNARLAPPRARFTAAHEFGHYVLNHQGDYVCYDGLRTAQEREANRFAAQLLMPTPVVKGLWLKLDRLPPATRLAVVAKALAVSREALGYRLTAMGLARARAYVPAFAGR